MPLQHYRQLIVWQKAIDLVRLIYELTETFPREELFGLASQMRRAAVSVPSNIAEGQGRDSTKEFIHHLSMSYGSLMEVETQAIIAEMRDYISSEKLGEVLERSVEVGRLINGLLNSLRRRLTTDH